MIERSLEQNQAIEKICEDHGDCEVSMMYILPGGPTAFVACEDGSFFSVNEDGIVSGRVGVAS